MSRKKSPKIAPIVHFEPIEPRILLDSQLIGTVTMPFDGYLSAAVYDSNGQIVRTLFAREPEAAGPVALIWDGNDALGKACQSSTYTWKALYSQVEATDQGDIGDSMINPNNIAADAGYWLNSIATSTVAGAAGYAGGTFSKHTGETWFGDTSLNNNHTALNLNSPISASGDFYASGATTMGVSNSSGYDGVTAFIGHYSTDTTANRREFMGLLFAPGGTPDHTTISIQAALWYPASGANGQRSDETLNIADPSGLYHFTYNYDPTIGTYGRFTARVYNDSLTVDHTFIIDLSINTRYYGGASFDAFGMGTPSELTEGTDDATKTLSLTLDNAAYTGGPGTVDFNTALPADWVGLNATTGGNNFGQTLTSNADGSLYSVDFVTEGSRIRKYGSDGSFKWGSLYDHNFGSAADETYLYVSQATNIAPSGSPYVWEDRIYRFWAKDGSLAPFTSSQAYLVVNTGFADPIPTNQREWDYTSDQWRTWGTDWGIAADGYRLWVSDYRNNRVIVYNRSGGAPLGQITLTHPLGIAVDTSSSGAATVWVANNGDRLTKLTFSGGNPTASTTITGLSDPTGVAIGGPNHHLFVSESAAGHIREYDISSTPVLAGLGTFGSPHTGGDAYDDHFDWTKWGKVAALAIDPSGILSVVDDNRIQRFYTTGGNAGHLYSSIQGEQTVGILDSYGYTADGKHYVVDEGDVYQVDPEYTGGPRAGWLGDGTYKLAQRYDVDMMTSGSVRRTIAGHDMLYTFVGNSVVIYSVTSNSQRLCAIVGVGWSGTDLRLKTVDGRYSWVDSDGDGVMDWNGLTQEGGAADEVTWDIPVGGGTGIGFSVPWVDDAGNIYITDIGGNLLKIPLHPGGNFDARGNPVYSWADKVNAISFASDSYGFVPWQVRIAGNGDIWALGNCANAVQPPTGYTSNVNGATWVARYNSAGVRQLITPTLDRAYAGFSIDETAASSSGYYFTGSEIFAQMFTSDGLMVDQFVAGPASGIPEGWMDFPYSLGAFTQPLTGQMYVYGADCYFGKAIRWRIDNLSSVQRSQADFTYNASTAAAGHWELNGDLSDTAGSANGTFYDHGAPTIPTYVTGHSASSGQAVSFSGAAGSQFIQLPYTTRPNAYTVSVWVKVTTLGAYNIISQTDSGYGNTSEQIRLCQDTDGVWKFEQVFNDAVGGIKSVAGSGANCTAVTAGQWYNVVITASNNGTARLYVNNVEQIPAGGAVSVGRLWAGGDRLVVGREAWGMGYLNGVVDDVRVYNTVLSAADIAALAADTVKQTVMVSTTDTTASEQLQDPGKFLIRRDSTSGSLTVNYTFSGAGNGSDYTVLATSVVLASGQSSAVITVTPLDDPNTEGNELVTLTLSANAAYNIGGINPANVTIIDNETTAVTPNSRWSFENNNNDYLGHHSATSFYYTNLAMGPATYNNGLIGKALSQDGYDDYLSIPYSTQASGYTISAWVNITQDVLDAARYSNGLGINVVARTNGAVQPTTLSEAIRLVWDGSNVRFAHYTYDTSQKIVTDATTALTPGWYYVAIVGSNNSTAQLYVGTETVAPTSRGTPQALGTLWTGGDRFEVGRTMSNDGKNIAFDGLIDELQIFDAPLSASQIQALASACVVTITPSSDGSEPSTNGSFIVHRTGSTTSPLTVNYALDVPGSTAANGSDFTGLSTSVVIPAGSLSATIAVTVLDDITFESTENVKLNLGSGTGYFLGSPATATINIFDNDTPSVSVTSPDYNAAESPLDTGTFVITRTGSTASALTVNFNMSGSASTGDYNLDFNSPVVIPAGQASKTITLTPVNDTYVEGTEDATLTLASGTGYNVGGQPATIHITSEDVGGGNSVTYLSTDTTTKGSWKGVYGSSGYNVFSMGSSYPTGVTVSFANAIGYTWAVPTNDVRGLQDPDPGVNRSANCNYNNTSTPWTITISAATSQQFALYAVDWLNEGFQTKIDVLDGATVLDTRTISGANYTNGEYLVYTISGTLTFRFTCLAGASAISGIFFSPGTAQPTVNIVAGVNAAEPSTNGTFIVSRTGSTTSALTVNYTVDGLSTATSGTDYTALSTSVVIPAGQASTTIILQVKDDSTAENTEMVKLNLASSSNYTIGTASATVNILDNEADVVNVSASDDSAAESPLDTGTFIVSRLGSLTSALTVTYAMSGSATSGSDYTALGTIVIPAGQASVAVTLTPINDSDYEPTETATFTVQSGTGYTPGTSPTASITITSEDALPTVSIAGGINAAEPSTNGTFIVSRTGGTTNALTVNYAVDGTSTATVGSDYSSIGTSVVIPAGQSSATITVTVMDDGIAESTETLKVNLSSSSNYTIGTSNATISFLDNDSTVTPNGQWNFDNNLNDSVGGHNGTFYGGTAAYATGRIGNAIDLNGSSNYIDIMDSLNPTAYTITAWIKFDTVAAASVITRSTDDPNNASDQIRLNSNGKFEHRTYDGSVKLVTGTTTVVAGTWYHVAITASNNGMVRLYVNGSEEGTALSVGSLWAGGDRWTLGRLSPSYGLGWLDGQIDDLRVYQQVLNASQVRDLAQVPPNGQWNFENSLTDSVAGHNGVFYGGTAAYAAGRVGSAINLNGSSNYVEMMYPTNPTAYTIMAWIKPATATSVNVITRAAWDPSNESDAIYIDANGKFVHLTYDGGVRTVTSSTTAVANTWYHVAIVGSSNGMARLYINGQEEGTAVSVGNLWAGGDRWRVGMNNSTYGLGFFNGEIDDLRVYEQTLSASEIANIAGYAQDGFESGTVSGGTGWNGSWTLSGGSNAQITTGNAKNGTYNLQLLSNNGVATRAVNLVGVTSAKLVFDWKANSFEAGETAVVEIYNGTSWITVMTVSDGQDDNVYHHADIDLSSYALTSSFQVRFRSLMSSSDDYFYVDNVHITK